MATKFTRLALTIVLSVTTIILFAAIGLSIGVTPEVIFAYFGCITAGFAVVAIFVRLVLPHFLSDAQRYGIDENGVANKSISKDCGEPVMTEKAACTVNKISAAEFIFTGILIMILIAEAVFLPEIFGLMSDRTQGMYDQSENKAWGGIVFALSWLSFSVLWVAFNLFAVFVIYMNLRAAFRKRLGAAKYE